MAESEDTSDYSATGRNQAVRIPVEFSSCAGYEGDDATVDGDRL